MDKFLNSEKEILSYFTIYENVILTVSGNVLHCNKSHFTCRVSWVFQTDDGQKL